MIKKLVDRLDMKGLDAVMLVGGLIGGLAGSYLAVRASEHSARSGEAETAVVAAATPHHAVPATAAAPVDADAPERHEAAEPAAHKADH